MPNELLKWHSKTELMSCLYVFKLRPCYQFVVQQEKIQ
jgi:hypothetical protein